MGYPTEVIIGDDLVFNIVSHDPDTGVVTDATGTPPYRVYQDMETAALLSGNMTLMVDDAGAGLTTGLYRALIACTAGNGFTAGKTYTVYIEATVDGDKGGISFAFKASAVAGAGSGARTVLVTVDDLVNPLENAKVRFTEGGNTYIGTTNASGQISFSLDDATYAVAITKAGYAFTPTTLVVDGDKTPTYSMTAVSITAPPTATTTTGVMTVFDEQGSVEEGVAVSVEIQAGPGTDGLGYDSTTWTETSNASGVVEFAGIVHGARYKIWRGLKASAQTFTAPSTGVSFNLAEVIGRG